MKIYNLIITSEKVLSERIIKHYNLKSDFSSLEFNLFRTEDDDNCDEWIMLILINNSFIREWIEYIFDNFSISNINIINITKKYYNFDYNMWDIIIPNTFVSCHNIKPIFLEPNIWENYNLEKFWLILNWICYSLNSDEQLDNKLDEKNIKDSVDLVDMNSYSILEQINDIDNMVNVSVLEVVSWKELKDWCIIDNLFLVLDLTI